MQTRVANVCGEVGREVYAATTRQQRVFVQMCKQHQPPRAAQESPSPDRSVTVHTIERPSTLISSDPRQISPPQVLVCFGRFRTKGARRGVSAPGLVASDGGRPGAAASGGARAGPAAGRAVQGQGPAPLRRSAGDGAAAAAAEPGGEAARRGSTQGGAQDVQHYAQGNTATHAPRLCIHTPALQLCTRLCTHTSAPASPSTSPPERASGGGRPFTAAPPRRLTPLEPSLLSPSPFPHAHLSSLLLPALGGAQAAARADRARLAASLAGPVVRVALAGAC